MGHFISFGLPSFMAEIPLIDFEPVAVYTCQGSASPSSPVSVNVTEKDTSGVGKPGDISWKPVDDNSAFWGLLRGLRYRGIPTSKRYSNILRGFRAASEAEIELPLALNRKQQI